MPGKKLAFAHQQCRLLGCINKETFTQPSRLKAHLANNHGFTDEAVESYVSEYYSDGFQK
jgi:hypothetical protein